MYKYIYYISFLQPAVYILSRAWHWWQDVEQHVFLFLINWLFFQLFKAAA